MAEIIPFDRHQDRPNNALEAFNKNLDKCGNKTKVGSGGPCLATIRLNQDHELRVTWEGGEDRPNISVRVWERVENGDVLPTSKRLSISILELPELADGMKKACTAVGDHLRWEASR